MVRRMLKDQKGQGLVEYALIIALVAVVVIGALVVMQDRISGVLAAISAALQV